MWSNSLFPMLAAHSHQLASLQTKEDASKPAFHFVSIALILAAKPMDAWSLGPTSILDRAYPEITSWIGGAFVGFVPVRDTTFICDRVDVDWPGKMALRVLGEPLRCLARMP